MDNKTIYDIDAEQCVLGGLIYNNDNYYHIQDIVNSEMFYVGAHGSIFSTIVGLINAGKAADPVTITSELGSADWFNDLGGKDFLNILNENTSRIINIKTYADIVFEKYKKRQCVLFSTDAINNMYNEEQKDTDGVLNDLAGKLIDLADTSTSGKGFKDLSFDDVYNKAKEAFERDDPITGIKTNLRTLDKLLGGLQAGKFYVIAAPSSMGKSAIAMNIAKNAAENHLNNDHGAKVGIFSLEMSTYDVKCRLVSSVSGVSQEKIVTGKFTHQNELSKIKDADNFVNRLPIKTDDTPSLHINQIRARALNMHRKGTLDLLIVDHIGLAKGSNAKARHLEIGEITIGLKNLAKELQIPIVGLSQVSREVGRRDNKIPVLSDLKDSASIEQDADLVAFLTRQEYYAEKQIGSDEGSKFYKENLKTIIEHKGITEFTVAKNRAGKSISFPMIFDALTNNFIDVNELGLNQGFDDKELDTVVATLRQIFHNNLFKSKEYIRHERSFIEYLKSNDVNVVASTLQEIKGSFTELEGVSPLILGAIASKEGFL